MRFIYGIYDRKMMQYQPALVSEVNAMAVLRAISDGVKRSEGTVMHDHPEDFDILCLGELDEVSGTIVPYAPPRLISNLESLLELGKVREEPRLRAEA